jgi:hypothetical protein
MARFARRIWIPCLIIGVVSMFVITPIGFLVLFFSAFVEGEEFSPDDFSRRKFHYVQLPGLKWVLHGIEYRDVTSDMELSLGTEGWISTSPAQTWHLCRESFGTQPAEADARFLVELLNLKSQKVEFVYYWQEWNDRYGDLAKVFWPLVADLARDEMYLVIPEFMQLAMDVDASSVKPSVETFENQLHDFLAKNYQRLAEIDRAKGRSERSAYRDQRAAGFQTK